MEAPDARPERPPTPALLRSLAATPPVMADLIGALHRRVHDAPGLVDPDVLTVLSDQVEDWGRAILEQAAEVIARNLPSGGGRG